MSYRPRYPRLNMTFACITTIGGLLMIAVGFTTDGNSEVIRGSGRIFSGYHTQSWWLILLGALLGIFGAYGVYHHYGYFTSLREKRRVKSGKHN